MAKIGTFKSIDDLLKAFPTEKSCIDYLESKLWPNGVIVSPFDPTSKVYRRGDGLYRCKNTGKNFNVRKGTMFEGTKLPLRTWFIAIYLITTTKKAVASTTLAQQLGVTQKTAWFLEQRIRETFQIDYNKEKLTGEVELDETFVGGKNKNRHYNKKVPKSTGRCHIDKVPVMGMLQRGGKVICKVVDNTSRKSLTKPILKSVKIGSILYMDEWKGYKTVQKVYKHSIVDHGHGIYAVGGAYTNTIEQFWGNFCKRSMIGIYNHVDRKHLQRYFDEFSFRYNFRSVNISERFERVIVGSNKRITWKRLTKDIANENIQRKTNQITNRENVKEILERKERTYQL